MCAVCGHDDLMTYRDERDENICSFKERTLVPEAFMYFCEWWKQASDQQPASTAYVLANIEVQLHNTMSLPAY